MLVRRRLDALDEVLPRANADNLSGLRKSIGEPHQEGFYVCCCAGAAGVTTAVGRGRSTTGAVAAAAAPASM